MLDVDVRGECIGCCAGVWFVGVSVAGMEGACVSVDFHELEGVGRGRGRGR